MLEWLKRWFGWSSEKQPVSAVLTPIQRIILTDGVARTLFEDYTEHRRTERGNEEIGWVLMGVRQGDEAIALAALPADAAVFAAAVADWRGGDETASEMKKDGTPPPPALSLQGKPPIPPPGGPPPTGPPPPPVCVPPPTHPPCRERLPASGRISGTPVPAPRCGRSARWGHR